MCGGGGGGIWAATHHPGRQPFKNRGDAYNVLPYIYTNDLYSFVSEGKQFRGEYVENAGKNIYSNGS